MPTILRFRNFRIVIHTDDHSPAHVHALGPGVEVILNLGCWSGPPSIRVNKGVAMHLVNELGEFIAAHLDLLCKEWE